MLLQIRDENLTLKELLVDTECDFRILERRYASVSQKIIQLQSRNATYFQELKEKDAKYKELSDQYQLLTQSLQSLRTNCACGALQIVYPVVAQAERLAYILSTEKTDEGYALQEYASIQQSQILVNEMDDQVRTMQRKIDLLEKTLEKREQDLQETNARMLQCAQQNAEDERLRGVVNRLNAEIAELRSNRRERESSLIAELNRLRQSMDQHVAALSKANDTINSLERQAQGYRRQGDVANKENAMLKAELYKARECAATQDGIEKSLRNQLMQTQSEMTFMKCDLERYTCLMQDIENLKKHCSRLKEANYDLVRKYNDLVEDYNNLEEEYRKLIDIKDQLFNEVENSRQWQKQQKEQDKIISSKFKKLEEHIDTLLDDRKKLIAKINDLHQDTILISGELEQFKDICTGSLRSES
ncbi:unnamed protein product [Hermetia illucens]|uniref:Uncharacterized protein n=1 Tax=Hermetia illucens TaxID=343691 RepID=A0A7R8UF27_HERIL|nr:unnamed protein product [Hermetia illucens]